MSQLLAKILSNTDAEKQKDDETYLKIITYLSSLLKFLLISASIVVLAIVYTGSTQIVESLAMSLFMGSFFGIFIAWGYLYLFLDIIKVHEKITWHRVVFVDTVVTLVMFVMIFLMPIEYYTISLMWGVISVIGDILAPLVILDRQLLKFSRIVGIITFVLGLILKSSGPLPFQREIGGFLSVLGGILSIVGVGEHAK